MLNQACKVDPDEIRSSLFLCVRSVRYMTEQLVTIVASLNEGAIKDRNRFLTYNKLRDLESDKTSCEEMTTESNFSISAADVAETCSQRKNRVLQNCDNDSLWTKNEALVHEKWLGSTEKHRYHRKVRDSHHLNNSKSVESLIHASSQTHLQDFQDKQRFTTRDKCSQTQIGQICNQPGTKHHLDCHSVKEKSNYINKESRLIHVLNQTESYTNTKSENKHTQCHPAMKMVNFSSRMNFNQNASDLPRNKKIKKDDEFQIYKLEVCQNKASGDTEAGSFLNKSDPKISTPLTELMNKIKAPNSYNQNVKDESQKITSFETNQGNKPPKKLSYKFYSKDYHSSSIDTNVLNVNTTLNCPLKTSRLDSDNPVNLKNHGKDWNISQSKSEEIVNENYSLNSSPNVFDDLGNSNNFLDEYVVSSQLNYTENIDDLSFYNNPISESDLLAISSNSPATIFGNTMSISDLSIYNSHLTSNNTSELVRLSSPKEQRRLPKITFPYSFLQNLSNCSANKCNQQQSWTNEVDISSLSDEFTENKFESNNPGKLSYSEKANMNFSQCRKKYKTVNSTNIERNYNNQSPEHSVPCYCPSFDECFSVKDSNTGSIKSISSLESNKFTQIFLEKSESNMIDLDVLVSHNHGRSEPNTYNDWTSKHKIENDTNKISSQVSKSEIYLGQMVQVDAIDKTLEKLPSKEDFNIKNNGKSLLFEHDESNFANLKSLELLPNQIITSCVDDCSFLEDPLLTTKVDQARRTYEFINESLIYEVMSVGRETIVEQSKLESTICSHDPRHIGFEEDPYYPYSKSETIFLQATLEMVERNSKLSESRNFKIQFDPIHLYLTEKCDESSKHELDTEFQSDLLSCFDISNEVVENENGHTPKSQKRKRKKKRRKCMKQPSYDQLNNASEIIKSRSKTRYTKSKYYNSDSIIECFLDNV